MKLLRIILALILTVAILSLSSCAGSKVMSEPSRAQIEQDYQKEVNKRKNEIDGRQQKGAKVLGTILLTLLLI